jgi:hypothetical protein
MMTAITVDAGLQQRRSFQEVWVISLGHALTHWYPATFYLLLPLIGKELGLSYSEIGSVLTCQYLAGAIANIPGGIFVDSVGRKGLLMAVSLFWIGFPYLMMGSAHAYWMILCCATLVGIGNNLWHPSAISWLANRFPQRKGLVMSIHSMGGNVGDAVAPLVAGALLGVLSWRDVVIVNVLPGMLLAVFIMLYLGRKQSADRDAGTADAASLAISGLERLRMFGALLKNRALITLAAGSAFRTMTQGALPAALSGPRDGLSTAMDRRLHVCAAGRRLYRGADRRASLRHDRPPPDHRLEHVDERGRDLAHDIRRRHRLVRTVRLAARLLSIRSAGRAASLGPRRNPAGAGRQRHRLVVREPGLRPGGRAAQRRHRRRSLRVDGSILFPRDHDRDCEFPGLFDAGVFDEAELSLSQFDYLIEPVTQPRSRR